MSHSVDEPYSVYRCERVTARKAHVCCACGESIDELVKRLADRGAWPDEDLNCGHDWTENFGPLPPEIERLAFLSAQEAQAILGDAPGGK